MAKIQFAEPTTESAQSPVQSPSTEHPSILNTKPEETKPSNVQKLVRRLTKKVKPSKEKESSSPGAPDSSEDKLAGFISRNPALYAAGNEEKKQASPEIPEPVVRTKTMSRSQRLLERLEDPLILDPTPAEEVEEQEKAKQTMRQSRTTRFRRRLEDYL